VVQQDRDRAKVKIKGNGRAKSKRGMCKGMCVEEAAAQTVVV
jgi:hypothetical protein